jgi:hypothetical protein
MSITALPTPPSRNDPANFAARGDAFLGALPTFATEANSLADEMNIDAANAEASAIAAVGAANYRGDYSAGTTYQVGQSVSNAGKVWIAKTINLGVTPTSGANWLELLPLGSPFQNVNVLAQVQATALSF